MPPGLSSAEMFAIIAGFPESLNVLFRGLAAKLLAIASSGLAKTALVIGHVDQYAWIAQGEGALPGSQHFSWEPSGRGAGKLSGTFIMKRTYQASKVRRARTHGFLVRMKTRGGRAVINARRAKGRKRLAV
jgi:large subunit ribosomal protein L34